MRLTGRRHRTATGRWILMLLILASALLAHALLFFVSRGGRIHTEGVQSTVRALLDVYLPLLAIMAAFYFAETATARGRDQTVDLQILVFSVVVTAVWALAPVALLVFVPTVERMQEMLRTLEPFGQTAALAAVAFFFGKSS